MTAKKLSKFKPGNFPNHRVGEKYPQDSEEKPESGSNPIPLPIGSMTSKFPLRTPLTFLFDMCPTNRVQFFQIGPPTAKLRV